MEQNLALEKLISIQGTLLMLDDATPHVAVPVQAICDGEVIATTLSDESGKYQFANLERERYQVARLKGQHAHHVRSDGS